MFYLAAHECVRTAALKILSIGDILAGTFLNILQKLRNLYHFFAISLIARLIFFVTMINMIFVINIFHLVKPILRASFHRAW